MFSRRKHTDKFVVPKGHSVQVTTPSPLPYVERSPGRMLVAHLGTLGEDQAWDVRMLFNDVPTMLRDFAGVVRLVHLESEVKLSDVVQGTGLEVAPVEPGVVWTSFDGSFDGMTPAEVGRLFADLAAPQWLFMPTSPWPGNDDYVRALEDAGVSIRTQGADHSVLIEVSRPDGSVDVLLGGRSGVAFDENAAAPWSAGTSWRAGEIRRLMLAVYGRGNDDEWDRLFAALLERDRPALFLATSDGRVTPSDWDGTSALPVFLDHMSLSIAVRQQPPSMQYAIAELRIRDLAGWLLQLPLSAALNVYSTPSTPGYLLLREPSLRALAQGRIPTAAERGQVA